MRLMILALAMALSASVSEAKTLIVYYSYTNHVKEMVDDLSNIIVADVVRIEPTDKSGGYELNNYAMGTRLLNAIRVLPLSTAYPVWTGIGAVGTVLLGMLLFHEPATFWKVFFTATLILSIIGLKTVGR